MFRITFFSAGCKKYAELCNIAKVCPGDKLTTCYIPLDEFSKLYILEFCVNNKFSFLIENGYYSIYIPTGEIIALNYIK